MRHIIKKEAVRQCDSIYKREFWNAWSSTAVVKTAQLSIEINTFYLKSNYLLKVFYTRSSSQIAFRVTVLKNSENFQENNHGGIYF